MATSTFTHSNRAIDRPQTARRIDFYQDLARGERSATFVRTLNRLLAAGRRQLQRLRRWHEHRVLLRTLSQLDPWQLKDIGISRDDLHAIAEGSFLDDPTRRRRHPHSHPRLTVIATTEANWLHRDAPRVQVPARPGHELPRTGSDR